MAIRRLHLRLRRYSCPLMLAIAALCAFAACAPNSYAGISFAAGAAPTELQSLARRAEAGDKQAQLELGIAYEEGRGVSVDLERARDLYRLAASDSGGPLYVYQPRVGEAGARVVRIERGSAPSGLDEAEARLRAFSADAGVPQPGSPAAATERPERPIEINRTHPRAIGPDISLHVFKFFPRRLMDGWCYLGDDDVAEFRDLDQLNNAEFTTTESLPDLDCYDITDPQWPAPANMSVWWYLGNFAAYLRSVDGDISMLTFAEVSRSSRLELPTENPFVLFSLKSVSSYFGEVDCAMILADASYRRGLVQGAIERIEIFSRHADQYIEPCSIDEVLSALGGDGESE